jgi:Ca2+-binding EF-hand superfamily protein
VDASFDRLRLRFDLLDTDKNGVLEQRDFELCAQRVIQALGADPESAKAADVRAGYLTYWQGLYEHADLNGDGIVDFGEYTKIAHDRVSFNRYVRPHAKAVVTLSDPDGDGWVEQAEYVDCLKAMGFDEPNVRTMFAELDAEGAGRVRTALWFQTIQEFYTSTDHETVDALVGAK